MASRILHRLRHALTGEGQDGGALAGCGSEAEDFPESSELDDDLEGLSTRLSGTLSFTSNEEEEEEEDGEEDEEEEEDGDEEEDGGGPVAARKGPERLGAPEDGVWNLFIYLFTVFISRPSFSPRRGHIYGKHSMPTDKQHSVLDRHRGIF
uniref:Uncharacterized protein n=1 Tax=Anolis carolinensis TaxID=28377 RepID=H9G7Z3_ANOCA